MARVTLTDEDLTRIYSWASEKEDGDTRYHSMTYEQGIKSMVEVLEGKMTVDDLLE